jgi:hypothetical protein
VENTGTGACDAAGAAAGATTGAAGALAPIVLTTLLAAALLLAAGLFLTGVQTLTCFFLPWTFLVTTLHVFLTLAAAFLCALGLGFFFLVVRETAIHPGTSAAPRQPLTPGCLR